MKQRSQPARRLRPLPVIRAGLLAVGVLASGLGASPARACAFDMIKPERTVIDWIVEADTLVLARPDPSNAFAFDITDVLRGAQRVPAINHLVNSVERKRLTSNPLDAVLFAHDGAEWRRVVYVDAYFQDTLDAVLAQSAAWFASMPESRIAFIEDLQQSNDPRHKAIVIGELDKVPYADLRRFDLQISEDELLDRMWSLDDYAYQAILTLLLGFTGTPVAQAEVHDYIDRVADWSWAENLGAFAAALIEMDGTAGVEKLASGMLADPNQSIGKIEQLVMALSVHHALASPELQLAIQSTLDDLLTTRPEAAVVIARQYGLRADWSQAEYLAPLVRDRQFSSLQDMLTVSVYIAQAHESQKGKSRAENEG